MIFTLKTVVHLPIHIFIHFQLNQVNYNLETREKTQIIQVDY